MIIIILHYKVRVPNQLTNHINQGHGVIAGRSVLITIVIVLSYVFLSLLLLRICPHDAGCCAVIQFLFSFLLSILSDD